VVAVAGLLLLAGMLLEIMLVSVVQGHQVQLRALQ
jgi:hypothetical protein